VAGRLIEASDPTCGTQLRRLAVALIGLGLMFASVSSWGQQPQRPAVVLVVTNENPDRTFEVARAVAAQLGDLPVTLHLHRVDRYGATLAEQESMAELIADEYKALAVMWCEIERVDRVYFYLAAEAADRRVLVRRVDGLHEGNLDDVIAIITRTAVNALLDGGEIGIQHAARAEDEAQVTASGKDEADLSRLGLDAAYQLQVYSREHPTNHGASVAARLRIWRILHGYVSYAFVTPIEDERLGIRTKLRRYPLCLGPLVSGGHGRLRPGGMIGVVLDFTRAQHRSVDPSMTAEPAEFRTGASLRAVGVLDVQLVSVLGLFLAVGVDVPLNRARYNVDDGESLRPVIEPWPVQPIALLGLTAAL
jgi:hypothetical protein